MAATCVGARAGSRGAGGSGAANLTKQKRVPEVVPAANGLLVDHQGLIADCGAAAACMLGASEKAVLGRPVRELLPEVPLDLATPGYNIAYLTFWAASGDTRRLAGIGANGSELLFDVTPRLRRGDKRRAFELDLRSVAASVTSRDMERLIASVETGSDPLLIASTAGLIEYVNPAYERLTGYLRKELVGREWRQFQAGVAAPASDDDAPPRRRAEDALTVWRTKGGETIHTEDRARPFVDAQGRVTHLVVVLHDVTERVHAIEQLAREATHDELTGLANRRLLAERLRRAIEGAGRLNRGFALVCIDLDGFKGVNDRFGHACGDAMLEAVAARLKRFVREGDTVARVGGDEFVAVLRDLGSREEAEPVVARMIASVGEQVACRHVKLDVGLSAGVSFFPQHGRDTEALFARADDAMYRAKQAGGGTFRVAGEGAEVRPGTSQAASVSPLVAPRANASHPSTGVESE